MKVKLKMKVINLLKGFSLIATCAALFSFLVGNILILFGYDVTAGVFVIAMGFFILLFNFLWSFKSFGTLNAQQKILLENITLALIPLFLIIAYLQSHDRTCLLFTIIVSWVGYLMIVIQLYKNRLLDGANNK